MSSFLTSLGQHGNGRAVATSFSSSIKFSHDLLRRAANTECDIQMLAISMHSEFLEKQWVRHTGTTFGRQIEEILIRGRNVSLFYWGSITSHWLSPEVINIESRVREIPGSGMLNIWCSGSRSGLEYVTPFVVAKPESGKSRWLVCVDTSRSQLDPSSSDDLERKGPSIAEFGGGAALFGANLTAAFERLCLAASSRDISVSGNDQR